MALLLSPCGCFLESPLQNAADSYPVMALPTASEPTSLECKEQHTHPMPLLDILAVNLSSSTTLQQAVAWPPRLSFEILVEADMTPHLLYSTKL
jgi:hypothetical protein